MKGAKKLEGWLSISEAASVLGISRQGFHKIVGAIPLDSFRAVGDKPTYIVRTKAVVELKRQRDLIPKLNSDMTSVLEEVISARKS